MSMIRRPCRPSSFQPRLTQRLTPRRLRPLPLSLPLLFPLALATTTSLAQTEPATTDRSATDRSTADRTMTELDPVEVRGQRSASTTPPSRSGTTADDATLGPLGKRPLLDLPYSISVVPATLIENQQATSLTEVMKYLPSTQMEARGGMDVGRPQSRGMRSDVVANNHLDGLNVVGTTAWPMEMMERVEVVNGLTGALYGPASPAGSFNFVQKRPTREDLRQLTLGYRSRGAWGLHADLGGQIGEAGRVGYRLNLLSEDGESFVKDSDLDRKLAALALDFRLAPSTVLELNASSYRFDKFGLPGSFAYGVDQRLPDAPDASRPGYGQPFTGMALKTHTGSVRLRHDFSADWSLSASFGRQIADRYLATATNSLQGNAGNYTTRTNSGVAGRFVVTSNQASLTGKARTGSIEHDLVFSTIGYDWEIHSAVNSTGYLLGNASFDQPQVYPPQAFVDSGPRYFAGRTRVQAFTVGDTLKFDPRWSLMLVASHATIKSNSFNAAGVRTADYDDSGLSGTAALTYRWQPALSTYLAYADSLQEGAVAGTTTANANEILAPHRSRQVEVGAKYALGSLRAGAALFQIRRPFAFTGTDNIFREQGEQRNRGLELTVNGELGQRWALFGGLTVLDARLRNTGDETTTGQRMVGVPRLQAALLAEYSVLEVPGLTVTGSLRHTGKREINTRNTAQVDGFTVIDLGARYSHRLLGRPTTWRLAINNVTDERYWAALFPGNIDGGVAAGSAFIGEPRELRLSATFAF